MVKKKQPAVTSEDAIQILTSQPGRQDSEMFQLASTLYDTDKIALISELSEREIAFLIRLDTIEKYCSERVGGKDISYSRLIPVVRDRFLEYRVSKKRKGRSEVFDAIKSMFSGMLPQQGPEQKPGILKRWFG